MKPEWKKYDGSDEQIVELNNCKNGLLAKNYLGYIWPDIYEHFDFAPIGATHYLICDPHPYADMICQWARTGQPVYAKAIDGFGSQECHEYFPPFAHPDKFEYSFTPFEE